MATLSHGSVETIASVRSEIRCAVNSCEVRAVNTKHFLKKAEFFRFDLKKANMATLSHGSVETIASVRSEIMCAVNSCED